MGEGPRGTGRSGRLGRVGAAQICVVLIQDCNLQQPRAAGSAAGAGSSSSLLCSSGDFLCSVEERCCRSSCPARRARLSALQPQGTTSQNGVPTEPGISLPSSTDGPRHGAGSIPSCCSPAERWGPGHSQRTPCPGVGGVLSGPRGLGWVTVPLAALEAGSLRPLGLPPPGSAARLKNEAGNKTRVR